jgi:regulatory protein
MNCLQYFYRLLGRREYSANELKKKGNEHGYSESEITEAINDLQLKDYQSDTRLVANLIASSQGKYGKSVLKRKCMEKGIPAEVFEEVWLSQDESDEIDGLTDLKAKVMRKYKIEDFQSIDQKTKAKLLNYLQYRGFNGFAVLNQWRMQQEEEE